MLSPAEAKAAVGCREPRQALVIHAFFHTVLIPVCLSTSTLGIISARVVSPKLPLELRPGPEPGIPVQEIEFRTGFRRWGGVLPVGVLKSDQL